MTRCASRHLRSSTPSTFEHEVACSCRPCLDVAEDRLAESYACIFNMISTPPGTQQAARRGKAHRWDQPSPVCHSLKIDLTCCWTQQGVKDDSTSSLSVRLSTLCCGLQHPKSTLCHLQSGLRVSDKLPDEACEQKRSVKVVGLWRRHC